MKTEYTLVYLPRGAKVSHVLTSSPNERGRAVCNREPSWPDDWFGTGSQAEYDKAKLLPCCVGCAAWLRQHGS